MNAVETFKSKVKAIIETANDVVIINGLCIKDDLLSSSEPPIITGSKGKMQGANIVKIPASGGCL